MNRVRIPQPPRSGYQALARQMRTVGGPRRQTGPGWGISNIDDRAPTSQKWGPGWGISNMSDPPIRRRPPQPPGPPGTPEQNMGATGAEGSFAMPLLDPRQLKDENPVGDAFKNQGKFPKRIRNPKGLLKDLGMGKDFQADFSGQMEEAFERSGFDRFDDRGMFEDMLGRFGGGGMRGFGDFIKALRRMSGDLRGQGPYAGR